MSNIPLAKSKVTAAHGALAIAALHLREAVSLMTREKHVEKTKKKSRNMTKTLANTIRSYKKLHTNASLQEIADHFMVNAGRVSEALSGKKWK